jgi:hypothetical protein
MAAAPGHRAQLCRQFLQFVRIEQRQLNWIDPFLPGAVQSPQQPCEFLLLVLDRPLLRLERLLIMGD